MNDSALEDGLAALGFVDLGRIVGGWQSVAVYSGMVDGRRVAVKVLDARLTDRDALAVRLDMLSQLRATTDTVCAPVPVGGRLVNEIDAAYVVVAYEFADGIAPDIGRPGDAAEMGRVLAELHASMAALPPYRLPDHGGSPRQVLHGDFSSKNVRVDGAKWRVFDFDDCGYGPVELDVANSLYFVLFDAMTGGDHPGYRHFREGFLRGYRDRAGSLATDAVLDRLITRRVLALASWLADPDSAPTGIRTASAAWRTTLDGFVQRYLAAEH